MGLGYTSRQGSASICPRSSPTRLLDSTIFRLKNRLITCRLFGIGLPPRLKKYQSPSGICASFKNGWRRTTPTLRQVGHGKRLARTSSGNCGIVALTDDVPQGDIRPYLEMR